MTAFAPIASFAIAAPLGVAAEQQQAWADYRGDLLDIILQAGFPHNVTWPEKPE